ncbi:citrate lyase subunit beta [Clostridiales bacterium PH28_bin88]|nr:citrate lyase subunit beta [Clostridiales bacterium PH28_bin88]
MIMRSYLFVPGNHERRVQKAFESMADVTILDLEDAVALGEKAAARAVVKKALGQPRRNMAYVRINGLATELALADLETVMEAKPEGVMVPKVESGTDVVIVDWVMQQLEVRFGWPVGSIELIPLIETARGVQRAEEIAAASARVVRLAFGAIDYTLDINTSYLKEGTELFYARGRLVAASRSAGVQPPVDTVFPDIKDVAGLEQEARTVRQLGFGGKLVIHPEQLDPVHRVFSPTEGEIAWAKKVVQAFNEAEAQGIASIQVDGKFIDYPVAAKARQVLATSEAIARRSDMMEE